MAELSSASFQSSRHFGDADQNLIFFDWDDTLFPTSDFIDRRHWLDRQLSEDERSEIMPWQDALRQMLEEAQRLSDRVVILTNSTRPWVEACIDDFAPELRPMFQAPGGPVLVYAGEALKKWRASEAAARSSGCCCLAGPAAWWETSAPGGDEDCDDEKLERESTAKKRAGMEQETAAFYSRYDGQSWKNVLSFGDMRYEHDAAHGLRPSGCSPCLAGLSNKKTPRARLRTKTVLVPLEPSLSELTVALHVQRLLLPQYVACDGTLDIDLQANANPIEAARIALCDDRLRRVRFPTDAMHGFEAPSGCEAELAQYKDFLCELQNVLQHSD